MKKFLGGLVVTLLTLVVLSPSAQAVWKLPDNLGRDGYGINIEDSWITNGNQASRIISLEDRPNAMPNERLCKQVGSGYCDFDGTKYKATVNALLGLCESAADIGCIEGVTLDGKALRNAGVAGGETFRGNFALGLPNGKQVTLWAGPDGSSVSYAVHASMLMNWDKPTDRFKAAELVVSLVPYTLKIAGFQGPKSSESFNKAEGRWVVGTSGIPAECVFVQSTACGLFQEFPDADAKFELKLRIPSTAGSWFQGRLDDPDFAVEKVSKTVNRIIVSGKPTVVPKVYVEIPKEQATKEQWSEVCPEGRQCFFPGGIINIRADYDNTPKLLEAFREAASDKAVELETKWSFGVLSASGNKCLTDTSKVHGIVSTNATVYQGSAPAFSGGTLNYRVSGYHFAPDGSEQIGRYSLIINSDTARCLYGFTKAPVKATVTVTGTDNQRVEVTSVSEKGGWLKLSATGFTYSQKSVRVSFSQPQTFTISKFAPGSQLSANQKTQITKTLTKSSAATEISCTGLFQGSGEALALARAQAACDFAVSKNKKLLAKVTTKATSASSYANRVMLKTN